MDQRLNPPWRAYEAFPVALIDLLLTGVLATVVVSLVGKASALFAILIVAPTLTAVVTILWVRFVHPGHVPDLGMRSERPLADAGFGFLGGLALYVAVGLLLAAVLFALLQAILGHAPHVAPQFPFPKHLSGVEKGVLFLGAVILAPVAEEIFFRGFLFGALRRRGLWLAAVISGVVFGLFHADLTANLETNILRLPLLATVGVGFALIYDRRKTLVASMAAHAAFNLLGVVAIILMGR